MGKSTQVDGDNNPTSSETDPTKLLEAALLQMDGIIAEAGGNGGTTTTGSGRSARARALELAQQLASSLQHAIPPPPRPDFTTASAILRWLQQNNNSVTLVSVSLSLIFFWYAVLHSCIGAMHNLERSMPDAYVTFSIVFDFLKFNGKYLVCFPRCYLIYLVQLLKQPILPLLSTGCHTARLGR